MKLSDYEKLTLESSEEARKVFRVMLLIVCLVFGIILFYAYASGKMDDPTIDIDQYIYK